MQTRLERDDCPGNDNLVNYFKSVCYSLSRGQNDSSMGNSTGFSADDDGVYVYWLDIHNTEAEAGQHVDFLRNESWLGTATQDLRVQIAFYNDQVALFVFAEVWFRLERNGRMKTGATLQVLPTQVYDSVMTVLGDVAMGVLLFWLFLGECLGIYRRCKEGTVRMYFKSPYTYVNWTVVIFGVGLASFWVYLVVVLDRIDLRLRDIPDPPATEYIPGAENWQARHDRLDILYNTLEDMGFKLLIHDIFTFMFSMVLLFKFFEAFSANPRLAVLTETFVNSYVDFFHFMIVFLTIFINFALGGYFIFGHHLEEWSNLVLSHITSFRALMGDFSFAEMYKVAPISATVWFVAFMILIFIIMLNMLLAIILDVYADVKDKAKNETTLWGQAAHILYNRGARRTTSGQMQLFTIKEKLEMLEGQEGKTHMCLEDLMDAGFPKELAKEMMQQAGLGEEDQDDLAQADEPTQHHTEEPTQEPRPATPAFSDFSQGEQPTPAPAAAAPAPAPYSADLENIAAGMRVLLERLEMLDERKASHPAADAQGDSYRSSQTEASSSKVESGLPSVAAARLPGSLDDEASEEFV